MHIDIVKDKKGEMSIRVKLDDETLNGINRIDLGIDLVTSFKVTIPSNISKVNYFCQEFALGKISERQLEEGIDELRQDGVL